MPSARIGSSTGRLTDTSTPGRDRAGRGRRRLWTTGLVATAIGAGLITPSVTNPEASSATVVAVEQARKVRKAPATTTAPNTTAPSTTAPNTPTTGATTSAPSSSTTAPAPTAGETATTTESIGSAPSTSTATDSPLAGMTFYGPSTGAAQAAAQPGRSPEDAAALDELAGIPTAIWLGAWSGDVTATVRQAAAEAGAAGAVPLFVVYNIPGRDCGGYSAGGENSSAGYLEWIRAVAAGIGTATAVVVVEPDALAHLCGDAVERMRLLSAAVDHLEQNPGTFTYLDAGHSSWIAPDTMAERLRAAGSAEADGFALNVSNFETTASNVAYGRQVSSLLGGAHFVVDTSRNGNGPGGDWCNPPGRALGERPTGRTGQAGVDAFLYIKRPGESDGTCNGGPAAGIFWDDYAIGLVRGA
jgi:endoglucanase